MVTQETQSMRKFPMMKYAARSVTDLYKEPATIYTQDLDEKGNKSALDMLRTFEDTISLVKKAQNWQYRAVFFDPDREKIVKDGIFAGRDRETRGSRDRDRDDDRYRKDDRGDDRDRRRRDEDRLDRGLDRDRDSRDKYDKRERGGDRYDDRDRRDDDKKRREDRDRGRDDRISRARSDDRGYSSRDRDRGRYNDSYRRDRGV